MQTHAKISASLMKKLNENKILMVMFEINRYIKQKMFSMCGVSFVERTGIDTPSNAN